MRARMPVKGAVLAFSALAMVVGCTTDVAEQDTTNSLLTIESILPQGQTQTDLQSDVCSNVGAPPPGCTAVNDIATVNINNRPKAVISSLGASQYQDVVIERYRVTYIRSDGRNTPGVEVPYAFDGAANVVLPIGSTRDFDITVVRQAAKLESPLVNLAFNGGDIVLHTIAQIDFFGKDVAGKAITVRGFLNITFGDF